MKRLILFVFWLTILPIFTFAQTPQYNNDWIDYSKTYWKLKVPADGLYRIPQEVLAANGIPLNAKDLVLINKGREVPIHLSKEGTLGNSDYIEFYGKGNDGEFDTQLFALRHHQVTTEKSLFTDTAAYYLTVKPNSENLRFQNTSNNLNNPPAPESYFTYTVRQILSNVFFNGKPFRTLGGVDSNFADFEDGEGFVSSIFDNNSNNSNDKGFFIKRRYSTVISFFSRANFNF